MPYEDYLDARLSCRAHGEWEAGYADGLFPLPGDKPRYARDRVVDIKHVRLDVSLDLDNKRIEGKVAHTFTPLNDGLTAFELDSVELTIGGVTSASGTALAHSLSNGRLHIELPAAKNAGEEETVTVEFSGSPRRGMYFIGPDGDYPWKRLEAWTQGQDEDSRHWFPCFDSPNEKSTSELVVAVPERFFALSNGDLLGVEHDAETATRRFHWRFDVAHSCYLITLAAGELSELRDRWDDVDVTYYVEPGREDAARRALGRTPEMLALFSERFGLRYPYRKYAQVCVAEFIFGGMENTTATTLTDSVLFDARAALDYDVESLVAHELAHQWLGDLQTSRDWGQGWRYEGVATNSE
jgi:aminopeptidase N